MSYEYTIILKGTTCWCGIAFAIPSDLFLQFDSKGKTIYCPFGHGCIRKEPEIPKLEEQIRSLKDEKADLINKNEKLTNENLNLGAKLSKKRKKS